MTPHPSDFGAKTVLANVRPSSVCAVAANGKAEVDGAIKSVAVDCTNSFVLRRFDLSIVFKDSFRGTVTSFLVILYVYASENRLTHPHRRW